ncbi:elongation factor p [Fagus crenata]
MRALQLSKKTLSRALFLTAPPSTYPYRTLTTTLLSSPASHNHIHRRDDTTHLPGDLLLLFIVVKTDHSHEGRGKATIKVELRDIESGNKVSQRLGTDENVGRVFVQEKTYMYMCTDRNGTIVLMDVKTFDQLEVSPELFGKDARYLQGEMRVTIRLYDDIPLSASVPKRVTCIVKEAHDPMKGIPTPSK